MRITIPIYIEQAPREGQTAPIYFVRPLFFENPISHDEELQRATGKFVKALRMEMDAAGRRMRHSGLAGYAFAPDHESHLLSLTLYLKTRTAKLNLLFVTFKKFDCRIAFSPSLPDLWFELEASESLQKRAAEVLTAYFRDREKRAKDPLAGPEEIGVKGKAWVSSVEIEINPPLIGKTRKDEIRAMIGGKEALDGELELQQVGRCLDWLYPDELRRVVGREREMSELTTLLRSPDRRPALLIGPSMVGKTTLVEEFVFRTVSRHNSPFRSKRNVWLIAPQRLISGMSFVGQWENRLLAILKEAKERRHILYFDDLIGLLKAGVSRDSNLNVAQVIKPYLERREIRVLAEITPEAWRVLRERDRGFADLFHLLPIKEPNESETISMMLGLIDQLEQQHRCIFDLDVLPTVIDLTRRYVRESGFPGKAAGFLRQLAVKNRNSSITPLDALKEFHGKSGMSFGFLSHNFELKRQEIIEEISRNVISQPAAIEAAADAICTAKARLNDPDRPLASFLFLGPTGVGKTQCAKSIAAYLYGAEDRLVRFDMNEFISPGSPARLVGTFDQPEGLLTAAVRRHPFSVVLLDEIEKAHPDVFNLLLQVMSDGRLTDSLGRTADFSNVMLILTSNLGVKEAGTDLGFFPHRANEDGIYIQAAEKFFSPEFFNRLDRIVPFQRLSREAVKNIVSKLIREVFAREGLVRRKVILNVEKRAMERIVDAGYHPQLGARALKRAIERQVTQPVGAHLAGRPVTTFMAIDVLSAPNGLKIEAQELRDAEPDQAGSMTALLKDPPGAIERVDRFLERLEAEIDEMRPEGAVSIDSISQEHRRYFAMNELMRKLRRWRDSISNRLQSSNARTSSFAKNYSRQPRRFTLSKSRGARSSGQRHLWRELFAAEDVHSFLREMVTLERTDGRGLEDELAEFLRETAWLSMLSEKPEGGSASQALILMRALSGDPDQFIRSMKTEYCTLFASRFELEVETSEKPLTNGDDDYDWLAVRGHGASSLAGIENGLHLLLVAPDRIEPFEIKVINPDDDADAAAAGRRYLRNRDEKIKRLASDETIFQSAFEEFFKLPPVVRLYQKSLNGDELMFDLRSGLSSPGFLSMESLSAFMLSSIPLPPELTRD